MIKNKADSLQKQIFRLRKTLSDLETKRLNANPQQTEKIWQEFVDLSVTLDQAEQALQQINNNTAVEINQLRNHIVDTLDKYNRWRKQMREMEISFMANILRPGYVLKQAIRQKAYLEREYTRIRRGIIDGNYSNIQELEAEIQLVLTHSDHAFDADERSLRDEHRQEKSLVELTQEINAQDFIEDQNETDIIQNFKRIVLPAVHPDTSETDPEKFLTVFESYATEDFLLMEAYVVEYRGEVAIDDQDDPIKAREKLSKYQQDYHRLAGRLDRKLQSLQKDLTKEELEDPQKLQQHLNEQRESLQKLIQDETQMIFSLREKIEGLIHLYLDVTRKNANGT